MKKQPRLYWELLTLVVGIILGIELANNNFTPETFSQIATLQLIPVVLGMIFAIYLMDVLISVVYDVVEDGGDRKYIRTNQPLGKPGELTVLLLRDNQVIDRIYSYDQPMTKKDKSKLTKLVLKFLGKSQENEQQAHDDDKGDHESSQDGDPISDGVNQ
jgi:hypothetical protein